MVYRSPVDNILLFFLAVLYATVSASYTIEQEGLPILSRTSDDEERWNGDSPRDRLELLRARVNKPVGSS